MKIKNQILNRKGNPYKGKRKYLGLTKEQIDKTTVFLTLESFERLNPCESAVEHWKSNYSSCKRIKVSQHSIKQFRNFVVSPWIKKIIVSYLEDEILEKDLPEDDDYLILFTREYNETTNHKEENKCFEVWLKAFLIRACQHREEQKCTNTKRK